MKYNRAILGSAVNAAIKLAKKTGRTYFVYARGIGYNIENRQCGTQAYIECKADGARKVVPFPSPETTAARVRRETKELFR